jgi:hypothetical protein
MLVFAIAIKANLSTPKKSTKGKTSPGAGFFPENSGEKKLSRVKIFQIETPPEIARDYT